MEIQTTEEDYALNRSAIQAAKNLFPEHESVLLLEVEQLSMEGDNDNAMMIIEKAEKKGCYDAFTLTNLRASIYTNQVPFFPSPAHSNFCLTL